MKGTKMEYMDPVLWNCEFTRERGLFLNEVKIPLVISAEVFTQITSITNVSYLSTDDIALQKLVWSAGATYHVNVPKDCALRGETIMQDTVTCAYGYYKQFRDKYAHFPFPRPQPVVK
jgi:hypothetical protein